jgi:hypothetical protein
MQHLNAPFPFSYSPLVISAFLDSHSLLVVGYFSAFSLFFFPLQALSQCPSTNPNNASTRNTIRIFVYTLYITPYHLASQSLCSFAASVRWRTLPFGESTISTFDPTFPSRSFHPLLPYDVSESYSHASRFLLQIGQMAEWLWR